MAFISLLVFPSHPVTVCIGRCLEKELGFNPTLALSNTIWAGQDPKPPVQESLTHVPASRSRRLRAVLTAVLLGLKWRAGLLVLTFFCGLLFKTHILQPFPPRTVEPFCLTSLILKCSNRQLYKIHLDREPNPNSSLGYSHVVVLHCGEDNLRMPESLEGTV